MDNSKNLEELLRKDDFLELLKNDEELRNEVYEMYLKLGNKEKED